MRSFQLCAVVLMYRHNDVEKIRVAVVFLDEFLSSHVQNSGMVVTSMDMIINKMLKIKVNFSTFSMEVLHMLFPWQKP